jgi:hypothetical protein
MKIALRVTAIICTLSLVYGCTLNSPIQTPVFPPTLSPAPIQLVTEVSTALPTVEVSATQTPIPVSTIPPGSTGPTRIVFPEGTTSTENMGDIQKGNTLSFLISAEKDQLLMVDVGSRNLDVYLGVKGAFDGAVLVDDSARLTTWQGYLPTTQDYEITLTTGSDNSNYDLGITIPAVIRFSPGAISDAIEGSVAAQQNVHYMLYALAGQTMTVKIHSAKSDVLLTLYGIDDGQPLVRSASGATEWNGMLSKSQNYMIIVVSSGSPSQYLLDITIQ